MLELKSRKYDESAMQLGGIIMQAQKDALEIQNEAKAQAQVILREAQEQRDAILAQASEARNRYSRMKSAALEVTRQLAEALAQGEKQVEAAWEAVREEGRECPQHSPSAGKPAAGEAAQPSSPKPQENRPQAVSSKGEEAPRPENRPPAPQGRTGPADLEEGICFLEKIEKGNTAKEERSWRSKSRLSPSRRRRPS